MAAPVPAARLFRPVRAIPGTSPATAQTPPNVEAQVLELRKALPTFGSRRLIREFDLRIGHNAPDRIWREHGLMEKRRRNISASKTSRTSKRSGPCFSKSAPIPRI
jgi:hypothetical protein